MKARLVNHIADLPGRPAIVTIDGRSGAGKTILGESLARILPSRATLLLEVELWAHGWGDLAGAVERVRSVIDGLRDGPVTTSTWNWWTEEEEPPFVLEPSPIILVVGCGAGQIESDLSVWIDVPEDERHARVRARDPYDWSEHWAEWKAQEEALVERFDVEASADYVLGSDDISAIMAEGETPLDS